MKIEIENITEAQAMAIEDMLSTWVSLGAMGSSRWTSFYADGDGNFRPRITVDGRKAGLASSVISLEMRQEMWATGEYRMDFDIIAGKLKK